MSFFGRLFRRQKKAEPSPLVDRAPKTEADPVSRSAPARSTGDVLSELRHKARTGDPTLNAQHHSGSFSDSEKK